MSDDLGLRVFWVKMSMIIAAVGFVVFADMRCSRSTATPSHDMTCEGIQIPRVGSGDGLRCENDEAVCYGNAAGALSCWRK